MRSSSMLAHPPQQPPWARPAICTCRQHAQQLAGTPLHALAPTLQAFMGEVAMWTGIVTGTFMFASPILFERLGWQGVASVTPRFMLWAGMPFFAGVSLYALWPAHSGFGAVATLRILVLGGAMLQVSACREVPSFAKMLLSPAAAPTQLAAASQEPRAQGSMAAAGGLSPASALTMRLLSP